MQNKLTIEQFQDLDPAEHLPARRISRTMGYQHSESIQEEDEEQSSYSKNVIVLGGPLNQFSLTCPNQPRENIGSDVKVPTIVSNMISNKSFERTQRQKESMLKAVDLSQYDKDSFSDSRRSFLHKKSSSTLTPDTIRKHVQEFVNKLRKYRNIALYKEGWDEWNEFDGNKYKLLTYCSYLVATILNIGSVIFVPIRNIFSQECSDYFNILSYLIQSFSILQMISDIYLQRGPYKIIDGTIKGNQKEQNKLIIDVVRLICNVVLLFFRLEQVNLIFILLLIIFQLIRQFENHLNIYYLNQLISQLLLLWVSFIIYFMCLYQINLQEQDEKLYYSLLVAVSLLTHQSVDYQISNTSQTILIVIYMLLSSICLLYTIIAVMIWLKPQIKLKEEKQKLLKTFVQGAEQKNIDYGLQCKCYSYLEYIIDEDLNKLKDTLPRKLCPELQEELQVAVRMGMLKRIKLIERFSNNLKKSLVYWFDQQQFNPEDNIVQESQVDDFCLYYILNGKVKIQFQGYYQGKAKRQFAILEEGQTFGEFSFITGIPPYISIYSCGLTNVLKIKRSDFIDQLKGFPEDNELFHLIRDSSFQANSMFNCYYCKEDGHMLFQCKYLQYYPNKEDVIQRYIYPNKQERVKFERGVRTSKSLDGKLIQLITDRAKSYQQKLSQELMTSEDFPPSSQLPYSENYTQQSASYLSRQSQRSPDNQSMLDSQEEQDYLVSEEILSIEPVMNPNLRKQQNKTTLRTAGFPFIQESFGLGSVKHKSILEQKDQSTFIQESRQIDTLNSKDKEETMKVSRRSNSSQNQVQVFSKKPTYTGARSMHAKLTFRYQQQQSQSPEEQYQQQQSSKQNSIRQQSNRSNTYSNPLSNNFSNPSQNSKQQPQPQVNPQNKSSLKFKKNSHTKETDEENMQWTQQPNISPSQFQSSYMSQNFDGKKKDEIVNNKNSNSDHSISDSHRHTNRKKSTKTGTKVSILNQQQSQFQIINTPDNHHYFGSEYLQKFEKMFLFKKYNVHNNYNYVIQRHNRFARMRKKKMCSYSFKCFVGSKIRKVKHLLCQT